MTAKTNTTVDAVSVEKPEEKKNAGTAKIDTSGLSAAINTILGEKLKAQNAQQTQPANPATLISGTSRRLDALYSAFEQLKKIATRINGKTTTSSLPDSLRLDRIEIYFYPCDDAGNPPKDEAGEIVKPECAVVHNIASVGDLGKIISTEIGVIIYAIQQEINALLDVTRLTKEATDKARANWDETNKDCKIEIEPIGGAAAGASELPAAAVTSRAPTADK